MEGGLIHPTGKGGGGGGGRRRKKKEVEGGEKKKKKKVITVQHAEINFSITIPPSKES